MIWQFIARHGHCHVFFLRYYNSNVCAKYRRIWFYTSSKFENNRTSHRSRFLNFKLASDFVFPFYDFVSVSFSSTKWLALKYVDGSGSSLRIFTRWPWNIMNYYWGCVWVVLNVFASGSLSIRYQSKGANFQREITGHDLHSTDSKHVQNISLKHIHWLWLSYERTLLSQ
jgi:hypothetical protein